MQRESSRRKQVSTSLAIDVGLDCLDCFGTLVERSFDWVYIIDAFCPLLSLVQKRHFPQPFKHQSSGQRS